MTWYSFPLTGSLKRGSTATPASVQNWSWAKAAQSSPPKTVFELWQREQAQKATQNPLHNIFPQQQQNGNQEKGNTFNAGQTNIPNNTQGSGIHETSHSGNETLQDEPSQEEWEEVKAGDRRHESDAMLAHAYREVAEASRDMAIWSQATAVSYSLDLPPV